MSLERALEYIAADEYVEATPENLRLRKKILMQPPESEPPSPARTEPKRRRNAAPR